MHKQLRIATLGDYTKYYSHFLYGTMEGAVRCGAWFRPIPLFDISYELIRSQINFFKPHILLCHCIFNKKPEGRFEKVCEILRLTRKNFGTKIFYHMGDARQVPRHPFDISDIVDFGLVNNGIYKKFSEYWNIPCFHWPYAALYQNGISKSDPAFKADVVFTGGLSDGESHHGPRTQLINKLKSNGINIKIYPDEKIGNSRFFTDIVSISADVVLGFQMGEEIPLYQDVRPFQYCGAGALYFHSKHYNMDRFFVDGYHYVSFSDLDELIAKLNHYKKNIFDAVEIRQNAFDFCQAHHSTKRRMEDVISIYYMGKKVNRLYIEEF